MTDSIKNQLENDLSCDNILDCLFDANELNKKCYNLLLESNEPLTVKQISENLNRDQSTINRTLSDLDEAGLINTDKETYSSGGYANIYTAKDSEVVAEDMREIVLEWNDMMNNLIDEFENKY